MAIITVTDLEKQVFIALLDQFVDELANNGCNDYLVAVTKSNKKDLTALIEATSHDEEEAESLLEEIDSGEVYLHDTEIVRLLMRKLEEAF